MSYRELMLKIIVCFLLSSSGCFSQKLEKTHIKTSFDVIYTSKIFVHNDLPGLNSTEFYNFGRGLNYIGIGFTQSLLVNRKSSLEGGYSHDGYIEYSQIIPYKILLNDSIKAKVNGFNFGMTLWGMDLFPRKKNFDIITSVGFNTGRVWLNGDDEIKQKNPYFSPMVVVIPRVIIGKLSIQLRLNYGYDISNKNWKRKGFKKGNLAKIDPFSSESFDLSIGIGYVVGVSSNLNVH